MGTYRYAETMAEEEETFESNESGASLTYPMQAGAIRKGGHVLLKGKPCKVVEVTTSKTGKHGHAKAHFTGIDIFTGKKYEDLCPTSHNMEVPNIKRTEYTLMDIDSEGALSVMDDEGGCREDLNEPKDQDLAREMRTAFEANGELQITVIAAMDQETVIAFKTSAQ